MSTMTLAEMVQQFMDTERPAGNLLEHGALLAQAIAAARFYAAWGTITSRHEQDLVPAIDAGTAMTDSEWALIRPLFLLYVERETALQLEASRGLGIDPFGRSSGEVANDITQMETELPRRAFCEPIVTV